LTLVDSDQEPLRGGYLLVITIIINNQMKTPKV